MFKKIIDILFPETCVLCNTSNSSLCESCILSLDTFYTTHNAWTHCIFSYTDPKVRSLIHSLKFRNIRSLRQKIASIAHESILSIKADSVTFPPGRITLLPVPKLQSHYLKLGSDALTDICKNIVNQNKELYSLDKHSISRINKKAQVGLSRKERLTNMKDAFRVSPEHKLQDKTICIIDDVMTTGSTVRELRNVCLQAGAKNVYILVIAH